MKKKTSLVFCLVIAGILFGAAQLISAKAIRTEHNKIFAEADAKTLASRFIGYYNTIPLTVEQKKIKEDALTPIPAPCCNDNSIKTCCCPCNLAKSVWGLSHYLIVKLNYDTENVKKAVEDWISFINPKGFSGNSCYVGRCKKAFNDNGCGGMDEKIIY